MMSVGTGMALQVVPVETGAGAGAAGVRGPDYRAAPESDNQMLARRIATYVLACWPFMVADEGPSMMGVDRGQHLIVLRRSDTTDGRFVVVTVDQRSVRFLSSGDRVVEDVVDADDAVLHDRLGRAVRFLSDGVS